MIKKLAGFALVICLLLPVVCSAGVDISLTGNIGYQRATLKDGFHESVTGKEVDACTPFAGRAQLIINNWKWKPTIEVSFSTEAFFDFNTWQAPVQWMDQRLYAIKAGVTKTLGPVDAYLLVGYVRSQTKGSLIEYRAGRVLNHGRPTIWEQGMIISVGTYYLFDVIGGLKIGPELSVDILPIKLGFDRCREFKTGYVHPWIGLRIQY